MCNALNMVLKEILQIGHPGMGSFGLCDLVLSISSIRSKK
ncbi:hypothetical protein A2U01_0084358, partial [Trifolium medium]|nr:hypothetical protein [Trifolium medium]